MKKTIEIFKTLSEKNRLKILLFIKKKQSFSCKSKTCLKDLSEHLNITLPTVSFHIKKLKEADLVFIQRKGKKVYCRINKKSFEKIDNFLKKLK